MNRIVKEHYPAERLPADLRAGLPKGAVVTVTVIAADDDVQAAGAIIDEMASAPRQVARTAEEIDQYLNALRREWTR